MGRSLGLMAGAGGIPGLVAAEARHQGWRVVAFAIDSPKTLEQRVDRCIPSRLTDIASMLRELRREAITDVVFSGKLWKRPIFDASTEADDVGRQILTRAGGVSDGALSRAVLDTLNRLGIRVLDQRTFLTPFLFPPGTHTARALSPSEWEDVKTGVTLAQGCASLGIGQTVVVRAGTAVAVEAHEGTDETIRRGCLLAGKGAVVVKTVGPGHDYRFDVPAVGLTTLETMAEGGAAVLAVEAQKSLWLDREACIRLADDAGIGIVSID